MTKHDALKDLAAVLRDSPRPLARVESGPAPLSAGQRYLTSNPTVAQGKRGTSLFSQLLPSLTGLGGGSSGSSLLGSLLGGGQGGGSGGAAGALGLSPILSGLLGLIGGGKKSGPTPLALYSAPQRTQLQSGLQGGTVSGADVGQSGLSRTNGAVGQPQVTLHIQAMDTQSILNRSTDIAQAVRQAMLQSHPINDVVADL